MADIGKSCCGSAAAKYASTRSAVRERHGQRQQIPNNFAWSTGKVRAIVSMTCGAIMSYDTTPSSSFIIVQYSSCSTQNSHHKSFWISIAMNFTRHCAWISGYCLVRPCIAPKRFGSNQNTAKSRMLMLPGTHLMLNDRLLNVGAIHVKTGRKNWR